MLGSVLRDVLDAFLPRSCGGCGVPDAAGWCLACARGFAAETRNPGWASIVRRPGEPQLVITVMASYDGVTRAALLAFKERGRRDLAPALGARLAVAVTCAGRTAPEPVPLLVVPVPASPAGRRQRGIDHVATLVRAAPGLPSPTSVLRWSRQVTDQTTLGSAARSANLAGALRADFPQASGERRPAIVLVDDVVTTGSTLQEAARACRRAGFQVVGAAALAATRLSCS